MTYKENITAILECYFTGFKEEIIDSACNRILEQQRDIEALPLVTIGRWIPVSERLPEERKRYIVATKYNDVMTDFYTGEIFLQGDDIIAWMPLPESYKIESEE